MDVSEPFQGETILLFIADASVITTCTDTNHIVPHNLQTSKKFLPDSLSMIFQLKLPVVSSKFQLKLETLNCAGKLVSLETLQHEIW